MTSLQISYFLKAADCMSFSRAAQELYVSQPSVSRQIKALEAELGYPLFDRSTKNAIQLTAAGLVYQEAFRRVQQLFDAAGAEADQLAGQSGLRLRVGVGEYWDLSRELQLFRTEVLERYPGAVLTFTSGDFRQLRQQVHTGEQDVILCTKTSLTDFEGLELHQLANLESRAYVRRGLLRPGDEPLQPSDFEGQRLLMLSEEESPMAMELALLQFQARQIRLTPVYLPNRDSILQALLMGDGIAVFDQHMRFGDDPRLTYFNLNDNIPICAVWQQHNHNPLIQMLIDTMTQYLT